jgi:hypothetical protein
MKKMIATNARAIDPATDLLFEDDVHSRSEWATKRVIASAVLQIALGVWDDWPTLIYTVTEVVTDNAAKPWAQVGYAEAYRYRRADDEGWWESAVPADVAEHATPISSADYKEHWRMRLPIFQGGAATR